MKATKLRRGRDGKSYPARPLTREQLNQARDLAHALVCEHGYSIRAAQARMAQAGIRRSVGIIARDLRNYECPDCADVNT